MSIERVLIVCKQLKQQGKVPTTALVKTKLNERLPLAIIMSGVSKFNAMLEEDINAIDVERQNQKLDEESHESPSCKCYAKIAKLEEKITQLSKEVKALQSSVLDSN